MSSLMLMLICPRHCMMETLHTPRPHCRRRPAVWATFARAPHDYWTRNEIKVPSNASRIMHNNDRISSSQKHLPSMVLTDWRSFLPLAWIWGIDRWLCIALHYYYRECEFDGEHWFSRYFPLLFSLYTFDCSKIIWLLFPCLFLFLINYGLFSEWSITGVK